MNRAHDIVQLDKEVLDMIDIPKWFSEKEQLFATVRRGKPHNPSYLPVGLRGEKRQERFAFQAPCNMIKRTIHPWELITRESFRFNEVANYPVYRSYQQARLLLKYYSWGIGGSLGFELAAKQAAIKPTSDLDLLLYADTKEKLPLELLEKQAAFFQQIDVQVITKQGGFALKEYLEHPSKKILVKTDEGPKLTTEIW